MTIRREISTTWTTNSTRESQKTTLSPTKDGSWLAREPMTTLSPIKDGAWLARELLTPAEQDHLRQTAEAGRMIAAAKDERLRVCDRAEFVDEELSQRIWARLQGLVPSTVVVDESGEDIGLPSSDPILHGTWRACGVNRLFRVVKYQGNGLGHFGPHRDGAFEKSLGERSLLTINGYLNELPEGFGGCTRFVDGDLEIHTDEHGRFTTPDSAVTHRVRPEAGCAVIFFHGLMHDGEPLAVGAPPKWLFRTEVMYQRDASSIAVEDAEARRLDVIAESIERVNAMAACELNKLSLRLRERRMTAEAARLKVAQLMNEFSQDEALMEELEEEISNAQLASAAQSAEAREAEGEPTPTTVPSAMPSPSSEAARPPEEERIHTCRRSGAVLLKRDFIGRTVGEMDRALRAACTSAESR